ncbi:class I SAM-dependent methyltransferase [Amycolatopsis thermophila]|uniref:SAM-dependent methyltransferase n=1 Tax=Amycolatopsis thermophila TaxID=206084 RepID=A0ABU0F1G6_9PSEU|nr:class I SAM-dependent methyltransferase [Amycolatopsis thermophila]MDQ0381423.1 SAM-dependent methyltransferase [Amycolatopsis thermophila]
MNTPAEIKACCAASYGNDAVALVLGESYHPGGPALTRLLAERLRLRSGRRVADIAAGPGATARLLAAEFDVSVDGVDLGQATVERAATLTGEAGLAAKVRFHLGDAERIPLPDNAFDAVVCECAFCMFPDKAVAAAEFARILRPGGRVGITDVTVAGGGLQEELRTLAAWVACVADARPLVEYAAVLERAGLRVVHTQPHDTAIARVIDEIDARLRVLRMTASARLAEAGVDTDAVLRYAALARQAVADGLIGYALLVAEKPASDRVFAG